MRSPKYMSPTSLKTFESNDVEYYLRYLADDRPDRDPQTEPMSVGSAFDAHVKSYLVEKLFGKAEGKYELTTLFEAQVEPVNRDFALKAGKHCFDVYKKSGALSDLMIELNKSVGEPRFEFSVQGAIGGEREGKFRNIGVPLLGKPDVFFINSQGAHCIFDWKVNGYCSQSGASPAKGYIGLRNEEGGNKGHHKDAQPMIFNGIIINMSDFLESINTDWATQLAIYAWLIGEDIGAEFVVGIDQLACRRGEIRIAQHRYKVSSDFQNQLFERLVIAWSIINSEHFFRDMSLKDSKARCKVLDGRAEAIRGEGSSQDEWFKEFVR